MGCSGLGRVLGVVYNDVGIETFIDADLYCVNVSGHCQFFLLAVSGLFWTLAAFVITSNFLKLFLH